MVNLWLGSFFIIWFIRYFAPYDSTFMNEKYFSIKNPIIKVLLIDNTIFFEKTPRPKKDLNKISILGVFLYLYALFSIISSILCYFFVSKSKVDTWIIETKNKNIYIDTLNEYYSACFMYSFYAILAICIGIRCLQYSKLCKSKLMKILLCSFAIAICVMAVLVFGIIIKDGGF